MQAKPHIGQLTSRKIIFSTILCLELQREMPSTQSRGSLGRVLEKGATAILGGIVVHLGGVPTKRLCTGPIGIAFFGVTSRMMQPGETE